MILVNEGDEDLDVTLHLADGAVKEIWDAWDGSMESLQSSQKELPIHLKKRESRILVVER